LRLYQVFCDEILYEEIFRFSKFQQQARLAQSFEPHGGRFTFFLLSLFYYAMESVTSFRFGTEISWAMAFYLSFLLRHGASNFLPEQNTSPTKPKGMEFYLSFSVV
jgi:hypothetical protein